MRIMSRKTLKTFWEGYQGADQPALQGALEAWFHEVKQADWKTVVELKAQYGNASVLKGGRVVFNICGNKFRLISWINYPYRILYIRWVGTHKDYDQVNAEGV